MIRKITLFLMLFFPIVAGAFTIGDLSYTVTNNSKLTVSVGSATTSISGDVVIPATVKYDSLEYIVTSIASGGFRYCDSLTSIEIPNSVTKIENSAFYACSILTSIDIPNSVTSIGERAFYNCKGLNLMDVPDSVATIGKNAFYGIDTIFYAGNATGHPWGVLYKVIRGTVKDGDFVYADSTKSCIVGYLGSDSVIVIPNTVTAIGANAFHSYTKLTAIEIPNSVTSIGKSAFYGCKGLNPPDVPESVDIIEQYAFYGIDTIFYAGKATGEPWGAKRVVRGTVKDSNFVYSDSTKSCVVGYLGSDSVVVIPNSVTTIGSSAFYGCSSLTIVEIPDSVTSIGASAFYDCKGLNQLIVPESVDTIGENAFYGVKKIFYKGKASGNPWSAYNVVCEYFIEDDFAYSDSSKSCIVGYLGADSVVVIPNTVTAIGESAFEKCSRLISIEIPNTVSTIREKAFYDCANLTSIEIPDSVSFIGENAFLGVDTISYFGDAEGLPWGAKIIIHDHVYDYCYCGICGQRDSVSHCIFDIYTADDLFEFARLVNEGNQWLDARLMNDIVVNDVDWSESGIEDSLQYSSLDSFKIWEGIKNPYRATFDGQNYSLIGLLYHSNGFFDQLSGATIKNVGFENSRMVLSGEIECGLISRSADSCVFINCHTSGEISNDYHASGFIGDGKNLTFESCYNLASVEGVGIVAGFVGTGGDYCRDSFTFYGCWNGGTISSVNSRTITLGGLLSSLRGGATLYLNNCYNIGDIHTLGNSQDESGCGGLVGGRGVTVFASNCYNIGKISAGEDAHVAALICNPYYMNEEGNFVIGEEISAYGLFYHNCYYLDSCLQSGRQTLFPPKLDIHSMTSEQFANGEVCYRLNKGVTDGTQPFYQNLANIRPASSDMQSITIDPYPVLDKSHRTVYTDSVSYFNRLETTSEKVVSTTIVEPKIYSDGNTLYVKNATGRVVLYEVNGRVVYSKKAEENSVIEIPNICSGMYLLVVDSSPYKVIVR